MPLIVEIYNNNINQIGGCPEGPYNYVIKVNRKVIASGEVGHNRHTHWSLLLEKIADDGRKREFDKIMES